MAKALPGGVTVPNQLLAASIVRSMCDQRGLSIVSLQPFMHYEGLRDRQKHAARIQEMQVWIEMAKILRTDTIAIPSTFLSSGEASGDLGLIVADLRLVADMGAPEGIRFAYEALCWGTHVDTWERSWEVVQGVDRPNFGICLDTFNIAGKVYADPESISQTRASAELDIDASLDRLRKIDARKIFVVQVVDAQKLAEPLVPGHPLYHADQPSRMSWSRNCRLFYGETDRGAYLPVQKILHTIIVELGFRGPVSAELFNACLVDPRPHMPEQLARRATDSWAKIVEDLGLKRSSREVQLDCSFEPVAHL